MELVRINELKMLSKNIRTAVTIGNFDGVHLGHRRLVDIIRKVSTEMSLKSAIITFSPHPRQLFSGAESLSLITTNEEKSLIFDSLEVDYSLCLNFERRLYSLPPEEFVAKVLVSGLNCGFAAIGENFTFGKGKSGDASLFRKICGQAGIPVEIVPPVASEGITISSERIRKILADGGVAKANRLLGAPYFVSGRAVRGEGCLVSIFAGEGKLLPKKGLYTVEIHTKNLNTRGLADITHNGVRLYPEDAEIIHGESVVIKFINSKENDE